MPGTSGPGTVSGGVAYGSPRNTSRGYDDAGFWYVDHLRHDNFTPYQTIRPENLHFTKNIRDKHTMEYEISLGSVGISGSSPISHDFIGPWRTAFNLRYGSTVIMSGPHSSVSIGDVSDDYIKVGGVDWLAYLERRFYPFDPRPGHTSDFVIGTPPAGLVYEITDVDASVIINAIWQKIFGRPYSLPLTYTPEFLDVNIPYFRIDTGDTTTLLSMLQTLSDYTPGFDFWIDEVTMELKTRSPYRFGSVVALIEDGEFGAHISYTTSNVEPDELGFTNTGPEQTHLLATGAGLSTQLGIALGAVANEETYWRLDGSYDAGDIFSRDQLDGLVRQHLTYGLNPVHEVPITLDPHEITDFWNKIRPGIAIWVNKDLLFHQLNSPQRVVSMDCTVDNEGNVKAVLGLNQIYDTTGTPGVAEG